MNTDLTTQRELLKSALEATDAYLGIEKQAVTMNKATPVMIHEFNYHMDRAQKALQILGVIHNHQPYMNTHSATMAKIYGSNVNVLTQPTSYMPTPEYGEMDETKEFYASAEKRAGMSQEKLSPAWKAKAKAKAAAAGREYPNLVDNVWAARKQEATISSFADFIKEESEDTISEEDINNIVDSLTWEDIIDLYPDEDLIEEEVEQIEEKLSAQARLRKRQSFARGRSKRSTAKGIKLRRASTPAILQKRAQLAARRAIYQRFLRGRDKSTLSASEKDRIEQQVKGMRSIQASIATRMVPKMRSIEQKRLANYRGVSKK